MVEFYLLFGQDIPMEFEFDASKSQINKLKHGIDFHEAQRLWQDYVLELDSRNKKEPRKLVIGKIDQVFWTAIITRRGATTRIISVRRSRNEEKELYKSR